MIGEHDVQVTVAVSHWYAGLLATVAAILNGLDTVEMARDEQQEIGKLLNRMLDVCHPAYAGEVAALLRTYAGMFEQRTRDVGAQTHEDHMGDDRTD